MRALTGDRVREGNTDGMGGRGINNTKDIEKKKNQTGIVLFYVLLSKTKTVTSYRQLTCQHVWGKPYKAPPLDEKLQTIKTAERERISLPQE